jgi:hypothetical protein
MVVSGAVLVLVTPAVAAIPYVAAVPSIDAFIPGRFETPAPTPPAGAPAGPPRIAPPPHPATTAVSSNAGNHTSAFLLLFNLFIFFSF